MESLVSGLRYRARHPAEKEKGMKKLLPILVATLLLWPLPEAVSQPWEHDRLISGWDALLEQMPFFLIVLLLIVVAWSVVLLVVYTLLPFSVFGLSAKLDRINQSLQALTREMVGMKRERGGVGQAGYNLPHEEKQPTGD